jgi:hypothetical protein
MIGKILAAVGLFAVAGVAYASSSNNVMVCHVTNSATNPVVEIMPNPNAVPSLLEHGDYLPGVAADGSLSCSVSGGGGGGGSPG